MLKDNDEEQEISILHPAYDKKIIFHVIPNLMQII